MMADDVCHRPDGLEVVDNSLDESIVVCHRPDGLEVSMMKLGTFRFVCHRPDGLEVIIKSQLCKPRRLPSPRWFRRL